MGYWERDGVWEFLKRVAPPRGMLRAHLAHHISGAVHSSGSGLKHLLAYSSGSWRPLGVLLHSLVAAAALGQC